MSACLVGELKVPKQSWYNRTLRPVQKILVVLLDECDVLPVNGSLGEIRPVSPRMQLRLCCVLIFSFVGNDHNIYLLVSFMRRRCRITLSRCCTTFSLFLGKLGLVVVTLFTH